MVPIFDAGTKLDRCLESLAAQTLERLEIVLIDDGSSDGSLEVARRFARRHESVRVVTQSHSGVGPARDAGVREASGEYLAFCDSDDEVPATAYERMVTALQESGSDIAIGSVMIQSQGIFRQPAWARLSNAERVLGVSAEQVPEIMTNLLPGTRVFRRSFWDRVGLAFGVDDHRDLVTMVEAMLAASRIDVLPAVMYRWGWREDGSSLLQRDLREAERVRCKVAHVIEAGRLVLERAPVMLQSHFFKGVLDTVTPDLVRAAVCREDDYWASLQHEMSRLMDQIPDDELVGIPVEDRIIAWLCASAERAAAEEFLEYAFGNQNGYPFRNVDGHPHITLPFIDALGSIDAAMTRVSEEEMRFRTRLTSLRWTMPWTLRIEGAAFVEYTSSAGHREVSVVLRDRSTGEERCFPAVTRPDETVNRWAARAQEDHTGAAFACEVDLSSLGGGEGKVYDVLVRLEAHDLRREAVFQSRTAAGSPGLMESSEFEGLTATPVWRAVRGLGIRLSRAGEAEVTDAHEERSPAPVEVYNISGGSDQLRLVLSTRDAVELALVGPRSRSAWTSAGLDGACSSVTISLSIDEWGTGRASLPTDDYRVVARTPDGVESAVGVSLSLWRDLPLFVELGTHLIQPKVVRGRLTVGVAPGEHRDSVGSYVRRRLRDEYYPAARERPLLDVALFETFAGRAAGDNPGPLCVELGGRGSGLDLVVSVADRSVRIPDGARSVIRWSPDWFELVARARYLVTNAPLPPFFRKRPGQIFLHTWHGTPLKRIAHDRVHQDFANWHHRRQLLAARGTWDYLVSQSPFCTEALRSAFSYDGEVLELGYPRNDVLVSRDAAEISKRTRSNLGIPDGATVILYAPTWRDNYRSGRVFNKIVFLDTSEVTAQIPEAVVLVRGHYNSMGDAEIHSRDRRVIDVTRYPDISDLYLAADALVTDYSSVFFDFVLTDKPMFFLAPDLEQYRDDNRGFYLDYHETVPGPVAVTTQGVVDALRGPDEYGDVRRRFRSVYAPWDDGHASGRIIDVLLGPKASPVRVDG